MTTSSLLVSKTRARLENELRKGNFLSEDRLPTQREWASRLGVSLSVVNRAINLLKTEGVIEAKQGSYSFLSKQPPSPAPVGAKEAPAPGELQGVMTLWVNDHKDLRRQRQAIVCNRFRRQFVERHPQAKIVEKTKDGRVLDTLLYSLSNGETSPTIFKGVSQTWLSFMVSQNMLAPLTGRGLDPWWDGVKPRVRERCSVDGVPYLMPESVTLTCLVYHKESFRRVGLDPERPPRDWEELLDYARKISRHQNGIPSFHLPGGDVVIWWLMNLAYQAQSQVDQKEGVLNSLDWNSPAAGAALELFAKMHSQERLCRVHELRGPEPLSTYMSSVLAGEAPMAMATPELLSLIALFDKAEEFGIAALPVGPNGKVVSLLNCSGWIANGFADEHSLGLGLSYLQELKHWLHFEDGGTSLKRLGVVPPLRSVLRETRKDLYAADKIPAAWMAVLDDLENQGLWEPLWADCEKRILGSAMESILESQEPLNPEKLQHHFQIQKHQID